MCRRSTSSTALRNASDAVTRQLRQVGSIGVGKGPRFQTVPVPQLDVDAAGFPATFPFKHTPYTVSSASSVVPSLFAISISQHALSSSSAVSSLVIGQYKKGPAQYTRGRQLDIKWMIVVSTCLWYPICTIFLFLVPSKIQFRVSCYGNSGHSRFLRSDSRFLSLNTAAYCKVAVLSFLRQPRSVLVLALRIDSLLRYFRRMTDTCCDRGSTVYPDHYLNDEAS